ncbi:amidohydrolase family protein [Seiridium cupressi]
MTASKILLQGGTLLIHDDDNHVVPTVADLLVDGQYISRIAENIDVSSDTQVIDCKDKVISPGFIDTHRHLWQTQYKGAHANQSLMGYLPRGNFVGALWSAEDLFWGELSGALESIDAGTTTLVDHSSCNITPDHPQAAIQALLSAGMRAIYCYTPPRRLKSRDPWLTEDDTSEENLVTYQALARAGPFGDGRVHVGYANDSIYSPAEVIKPFYATLRDPAKGKAKLITTHTMGGAMQGKETPTAIEVLNSHGLLGPDVLFSHTNWPHEGDGKLYQTSGASVSSTPNTELQMGRMPVALFDDHYHNASIGVDCHSWGVTGIPGQMRLLLQAARADRGEQLTRKGLWTQKVGFSAEQVFNLGTLGSAKACGLQNEIGSLKEGMKADIVIFDGETPSMLAAAAEDPVAAVVLHSNPSDIDTVIIDGVVRKEKGKLVETNVASAPNAAKGAVEPGTRLSWKEVARNVLESRQMLKQKADGIDFQAAEDAFINAGFLDTGALLEAQ